MSGSGFDMALLEGKDRAELAAIAEQLGQKPGARAKKADIVSLIMQLVGAHEGETGAAAGAEADAAQSDDNGSGGHADDVADQADAEQADDDAGAPAARDDESGADDGSDVDDDRPGDEVDGNQADRSEQGRRPNQNQSQGNRNDGGNQNGNGNQGNQNPNQGNQNQGGEGQDGDFESANRRRRRRGRDRDRRPEGDEQVQVEPIEVSGMVDLREEGYGFLRLTGYLPSRDDAYISVKQTRQFGLRTGDLVTGKSRPPARNEKNPALLQVDTVNGYEAHNQPPRPRFDDLTAVFPDQKLTLELPDDPTNLTVRIIDLLAPIGRGARGLIVSPPKAGKTTIIKNVVRSIEVNHPEVEVIVVLIDERPEEVTDMQRWLLRGSVAASTFDRPADEHTSVAELVIERAKRLVESGKDVVVVLDGITRLARAYNLTAPATGRTTAGGLEPSALYPPKRLFGAARKAEEGGSLTILATAQVETESYLDDVIFEEFQGTETVEIKLDRRLAERRVHPAIDVDRSSTRHADRLVERTQQEQVATLRRVLQDLSNESGSNAAGLAMLLERLAATKTNADFLAAVAKG